MHNIHKIIVVTYILIQNNHNSYNTIDKDTTKYNYNSYKLSSKKL